MERRCLVTQSACPALHLRVSEFYSVQEVSCCVCKPNLIKSWYLRIQAREAEFFSFTLFQLLYLLLKLTLNSAI